MGVFLGHEDPTEKGERTVAVVRFHSSGYVAMSTPNSQTKAMAASLMESYRERQKRGWESWEGFGENLPLHSSHQGTRDYRLQMKKLGRGDRSRTC
jgi:hypothetical protein